MTESSQDGSTLCIDVHGHGVPRGFLEEIRRSAMAGVSVEADESTYRLQFPGESPLRPITGIMLDYANRSGWLDQQHVATQVIAPWLDIHGQQLSAPEGQAWVRLLNDAMAEAVAESPGRLKAHATLHLADPAAAARELERAHHELAMTSCMIPTTVPMGYLPALQLDDLWEAAAGLDVPVVLHPPTHAPSSVLFERFPKLRTLGRAIDTTVAAAGLITSGLLDRFPSLQLVLVHGGGFLPYQIRRLDEGFQADKETLPSDYVKRLYYDTTLMTSAALRMLHDYVGPSHIMVGSDYAATPAAGLSPDGLTTNVLQANISEADTALILRDNAQHIFKVNT